MHKNIIVQVIRIKNTFIFVFLIYELKKTG